MVVHDAPVAATYDTSDEDGIADKSEDKPVISVSTVCDDPPTGFGG